MAEEKKELATVSEKKTELRGNHRGKGSRPDKTVETEPGDNRHYLMHNMKMFDWPSVNMKEPVAVAERLKLYFATCAEDDMKPSVAGMALAFGIDRRTLWKWINGLDSAYIPAESRDSLKKAYQLLNAQMENYMQNGKINPVAGIFLMKNNMGYQDKQEVVLTPNQQLGDSATPEELERKYLEATAGDYAPED